MDTYNGRSKRTVQPSTPLTDELRSRFRHIRLSLTGLDVGQCPPLVGFGDKLETEDTILGQEHVLLENVHTLDTLRSELLRQGVVTVEVLLERASHDRAESVGGKGTWQHRDVTERGLERLVQDVGHLVLEVLCGDEWIEQLLALVDHGMDLSTASAEVRVVVERLPQMVDSFVSRFGTSVDENANLGVHDLPKRIEEPAVRVDLLLVLRLDDEDELDGHEVVRVIRLRNDELRRGVD